MARNSTASLITGLIAGSVIGATLGLLYAPQKGKRLRADISKKAEEIKDIAEGVMHEAGSKASGVARDVKKTAGTVVDGAQKVISRIS